VPVRRGSPVALKLPLVDKPTDLVAALGAVTEAVSTGELTPDEGQAVAAILEGQRRAIANRPQLIMIYGGLPGDGLRATVGDRYLEAEPDELLEDFKERVIETAAEVRVPFAVIGGLTRWPR
jgi:hypothetical protein